jgi:hypothetical protein
MPIVLFYLCFHSSHASNRCYLQVFHSLSPRLGVPADRFFSAIFVMRLCVVYHTNILIRRVLWVSLLASHATILVFYGIAMYNLLRESHCGGLSYIQLTRPY